MEIIAKERDRLLHRSARAVGLTGTGICLVSVSVPGTIPLVTYIETLPLFAALIIAQVMTGRQLARRWLGVGLLSSFAILLVVALSGSVTAPPAMVPLAAVAMGSFALTVRPTIAWMSLLGIIACASILVVNSSETSSARAVASAASIAVGWILIALMGHVLHLSIPRASRRIYSIGKAHRAERHASETEAQRRQSARLLHDTVLATLTLLAHSGVGVAPAALQQQAADDARLLRQLRLETSPPPLPSGSYSATTVSDLVLGTTLESVKQRFGRIGLEVSWHGTGQVLLPTEVLDAFLLSLAECLENVRRHSGVSQADVTITDDDTTVRAMVTDAGVGFNLEGIDEDRLGFRDSVLGRLREVGGNARLFSSEGSGTTVVLEVPK